MKKGEVFGKICKDCKLLHKHAVCAKCHDFWVMRYETMFNAQASAAGKNGALQAKTNIAERKLKESERRNLLSRQRIGNTLSIIEKSSRWKKKRTIQDVWHSLMTNSVREPKK